MKVKIITADSVYELEYRIDKFLNITRSDRIINIQYQGVGNHSTYSIDRPSAMIIMK